MRVLKIHDTLINFIETNEEMLTILVTKTPKQIKEDKDIVWNTEMRPEEAGEKTGPRIEKIKEIFSKAF